MSGSQTLGRQTLGCQTSGHQTSGPQTSGHQKVLQMATSSLEPDQDETTLHPISGDLSIGTELVEGEIPPYFLHWYMGHLILESHFILVLLGN